MGQVGIGDHASRLSDVRKRAEPEEIFFTSGGTEADNWAVKGSEGGLLVSAYEHHAVLNAAAHEAVRGRMVVYARPTRNGVIGVRQIADAWQKGIGLVSVMTANNEIGTVNDVGALAAEAHSRGALFHTDAVQAVGHIPIDARKLDVDFLSASDSQNTQVSHVLKAIQFPVRYAKGVIRISLGAENTLEDVRRIVDAMR